MKSRSALLIGAVALPLATASNTVSRAANLTPFEPDVVVECTLGTGSGSPDQGYCEMNCFQRQQPTASQPITTFPDTAFRRLEFFVRPQVTSDSWIVWVDVIDRQKPSEPYVVRMLTLSHGDSCVYSAVPPAKIKMSKYYNQPPT